MNAVALIKASSLTPKQKRVLRSLVRHRRDHDQHALYSTAVQQPRRVIRELVDLGVVIRVARFHDHGEQKPNGYAIRIEALTETAQQSPGES